MKQLIYAKYILLDWNSHIGNENRYMHISVGRHFRTTQDLKGFKEINNLLAGGRNLDYPTLLFLWLNFHDIFLEWDKTSGWTLHQERYSQLYGRYVCDLHSRSCQNGFTTPVSIPFFIQRPSECRFTVCSFLVALECLC